MKMLSGLSTRLVNETRGSVAIIFAMLTTSLLGAIALTVDLARAHNTQTRVLAALDAAALAGAKALDSGKSDTEVLTSAKSYFDAMLGELKINGVTTSNFQAPTDRANATVTTSVTVTMNTMFGRAIGRNQIQLDRTSTVAYKTRFVELAMALDITGSMADSNKINDLKVAAKDVVKTLFDESSSEDGVRVSIVPWAAAVNVGSYAATVAGGSSADGCVVERLGTNEATDAAPIGADALPAITTSPLGYNCPTSPVIPLSGRSKKSTLDTAIDNLTTFGGTAGHIGTAWGWYTIAPAWTSIWPTGSKPRPYAPNDTIKGVLLMTDGEFNISWATTQTYDPVVMGEESYSRFQALCTEMKAKNVVVYTVGFGLTNARAIDELRNCATGTAQFFQAANGSDLKKAFQEIAVQLTSMRITK